MLCALLQFGSLVWAVNSRSPPTARTRRSEPRTALSKRLSSRSSSTRSWPDTITSGRPMMSSRKIGPSSFVSRPRCCTGAFGSSDSMLPTTGFFGGCGIGLSLLGDAIASSLSCLSPTLGLNPSLRAKRSNPSRHKKKVWIASSLTLLAMTTGDPGKHSVKSLPTPFDQLGANLFRLFLVRPMAAVLDQIFFQIGNELLHAVGGGGRQHRVVLGHDHQRRHPYGVIEAGRALPVAGEVAIPVDAAGEARLRKGVDEDLLFLRRQDRRARIVLGVVIRDHLRKRQIESR